MADALEAARQDVLEKALDEIGAGQAQGALPAALAVGTYPKQYFVAVDAEDALVGNRHPVRVAAEVVQHRLSAAQRLLGIDHPVVGVEAAT